MEEQKSEGVEREGADRGYEDVDSKHDDQPLDDTGKADTGENLDSHQVLTESPYYEYDWDEPFEVAIEDVHLGVEEKIQETAAGGRRPRLNLGGISRIVLDPEQPARQQPVKMKKTKDEGLGKEPSSETNVGKQASDPKKKKKGKEESEPKLGQKRKTLAGLVSTAKIRLWTTADIHRDVDPESYVIFSMRDFVLYVIFLVITATISFGSLAYAYNYYANVLTEVLTNSRFSTDIGSQKTFKEIHRIQDIWLFINSVLLTVLYPDLTLGGNRTSTIEDPVTKYEGIRVLEQNILVGAPQIRQVRVKSGTCSPAPMFKDAYVSCYDYYHDDIQDKNDYGKKSSQAFHYNPPQGINFQYPGQVSSYGEGGFMMNFSKDVEFTKSFFQDMQDNIWIQIGTRAVFIDFTLYTVNANLFCVVKLLFEIIPAGGVVTSSDVHVLKLLRYVTPWDYFIAGCEIVFICYAIYFLIEEIQQMVVLKEYYLTNWWNILDSLIVLCSFVAIALGIARLLSVQKTLQSKVLKIHTEEHASFEYLTRIQNAFNVNASILTFLVWLKLVKFSSLNRSVSIIISTFGRVKLELVSLVIMMIAVVMGFALLGNALFGSQVIQFRTVNDAFFTLIGLFIGGLYFYEACRNAARFSSQIYFVLFIFFVLVIFLSAFVALIVYGFHKAVNEIDDNRDRVYLGDVCSQLCMKVLTTLRRKKLAAKIRARQLAKLHKRDYDALLSIIRRHGYRGLDLALLLKKHNVKAGQPISLDTMSDLYNDLTTRNQLHMEVEEHDKIMEHIDKINKTIEFLDLTLADIVAKVDILANKLVEGKGRR